MDTTTTLEYGKIFMMLFGGLAIFLFGMEQLDNALRRVAGARMKKMLATLTTNRFTGVLTGTFVTSVLQSSSVTTVLVVGFVSAGLMSLMQSIPVIMGANIGTTITAQIIAFKVTKYALWLVTIGFVMHFVGKKEKIKQYGLMLLGLGLVFYGLTLMGTATKPLRSYEPFIIMLQQMANPLLGILVGGLFTAVVQSSSATTGIIIVLASQGLITLEAGIALAFGANLGTCVTAMLASIGRPREAVQASVVHILFNVAGVVLWFFFIPQLATAVTWLSPAYPALAGTERMAAETPRQIANAHTLFNVFNTFIFVWLVNPMARLVQFLVPEKTTAKPGILQPRYLDPILLETPDVALGQVRQELGHLGELASEMLHKAMPEMSTGTLDGLNTLEKMDENINTLHREITDYLSQLSQQEMLTEQSVELAGYMAVANYIENIGNRVKTNMVEAGRERLKYNAQMSEGTIKLLSSIDEKIIKTVDDTIQALVKNDPKLALQVINERPHITQLIQKAEQYLSYRMTAKDPNRAILFHVEFEVVEYHERIYYFAERIANVVAKTGLREVDMELHTDEGRQTPDIVTPLSA